MKQDSISLFAKLPAKRYCRKCGKTKSIRWFYNATRRGRKEKQYACKTCQLKQTRRWQNSLTSEEKRIARRRETLRQYGMTLEDYDRMLEEQNGVCAICCEPEVQITKGTVPRLAVDHDDETGRVRGLLCAQCNQGIGKFKHRCDLLFRAISYLKQHEK